MKVYIYIYSANLFLNPLPIMLLANEQTCGITGKNMPSLQWSAVSLFCTLLHIPPDTFCFNRDIYILASLCVGVIASVWWGNAALPRAPTRSLARRKVLRYLSFSIKAQELLLAPWKRCLSDIILHCLVAKWGPVFHSDVVRRIFSWNIATKSRISWLKLAGMSSSPSVTDTEPEPDPREQGHMSTCLPSPAFHRHVLCRSLMHYSCAGGRGGTPQVHMLWVINVQP